MTVRLTETAISKAIREAGEKGRKDLSDAALPGLRLRVTPNGVSTWALACRDVDGRMRRFQIGAYPAIGISDARELARGLRVKIRSGADPIAEGRRRRAITRNAAEGVGTLRHLLDLYGGPAPLPKRKATQRPTEGAKVTPIGPGVGQKSWPVARGRIDRVFKSLLGRPLDALRSADLQMVADAYAAKQIAASAVRCLRPVLKWGAARDYVASATATLKPPAQVQRRERVLTRAELKALLLHLQNTENPYRRAMCFMLLTLARREEVGGAKWRDIDLIAGHWRLPKTKNGLDHVVPLSDQAMDLMRAIGPKKGDALVFASRTGGLLCNWDRESKSLMKASGTQDWTRHDLRRTGATLLGELGVEPHVIESALNHALIGSQIGAVYNRARYRPAVSRALQMLGAHLEEIAGGDAKVIQLKAG